MAAEKVVTKWLNCVKDILNKCGFINYWNDQFVPRNVNLSKKVKQYFYDSYVEYWKLQIFNAPIFFCQSEIQDGHHVMTKFYDGTLLEISL